MSIFKDTFIPEVQKQLGVRQNALLQRTPNSIKYLLSRNAWIRMTSSVNVNGSDSLAKDNILQGGVRGLIGGVRAGFPIVGTGVEASIPAYDRVTSQNTPHQRGVRPMPGITDINVKSKSAYGSLREVVVNFQCWDIKQLEELELLYMRPGYTVLVEWGWNPYLMDENKPLENFLGYLPMFDKQVENNKIPTKEQIWSTIFNISKKTGGNYDATFGYIKNYSWSARPDGGYDCSTTIISIGEVIESLKINYTPLNLDVASKPTGLLFKLVTDEVTKRYKKNILAGLFAELYEKMYYLNTDFIEGSDAELGKTFSFQGNLKTDLKFYIRKLSLKALSSDDEEKLVNSKAPEVQIYIKLSSLVNLLNEKVILSDKKYKTPLVKLSTKERSYDKSDGNANKDLLCLAHPLQISVDPSICLVGNDLWSNIKDTSQPTSKVESLLDDSKAKSDLKVGNKYDAQIQTIIDNVSGPQGFDPTGGNEKAIIDAIQPIAAQGAEALAELNREFMINAPDFSKSIQGGLNTTSTLYDYISGNITGPLTKSELYEALGITKEGEKPELLKAIQTDEWANAANLRKTKAENSELQQKAIAGAQYLKYLDSFFSPGSDQERGIIGNIYINLQYLYGLSLDNNLESQDKKEKQEIAIYDYIKNVISSVSNVTGNINNFDIHVDPVDNVARIIDINYVNDKNKTEVLNKENTFTLQIQNTSSTVRNYKLESEIFQEQSTMVAIGAQVQGGALGTDSNTMSGFNKNITDRIIPIKKDTNTQEKENEAKTRETEYGYLVDSLSTIYSFFADTTQEWIFWSKASYDANSSAQYAGALRDVISKITSFSKNPNKYNAIIPTKLSLEMDGIGGLVIGHIFRIPDDALPKGYKGGAFGSKLGYIITGIGHKISNNDWTTNIDSQTIILDDPTEGIDVDYKALVQIVANSFVKGATAVPADLTNPPITTSSENVKNIPKNSTIPVVQYLEGKKYSNGRLPNSELRYLNIPDDPTSNKLHRLFPIVATQWEKLVAKARQDGFTVTKFNISYKTGAAYRDIKSQKRGEGRATPGSSPHGWGIAVDIQQLIQETRVAAGLSPNADRIVASPVPNAKVRKTSALYKWLDANAADFGFINPPLLKDSAGKQDETWHWEYWGPLSGGALNQPESSPNNNPTSTGTKVIAQDIKNAAAGAGTNESNLIAAIKKIKDVNTFKEVNKIVNIQNILNQELGIGDVGNAKEIRAYLATIGVIMNFTFTSVLGVDTNVDSNSIKITYK
jgi:hypothetical protein